ncbi:MAG: InlB B-repeat-containing protein [Methanobrevibacter sp.]|nr:InlB B-repeat-containing protein [Methanobrevibacter sp.]
MISMAIATFLTVNIFKEIKKDTRTFIESKNKIISYKVIWHGNGGRIDSKKFVTTTVKKGTKVKLPKTPKRTGYTFQGEYTKNILKV